MFAYFANNLYTAIMPNLSIPASELIINEKGNIYHLDVHPSQLADTVITVGDPDRVSRVSRHFDAIEARCQHREFVTHTGRIGQKRISVVSTGIGPDNIDIVLNELDALANIDFETRTIRPTLRTLNIVRLGTSGSLQADIAVDDLVLSSHGLGLDNLMHFYARQKDDKMQDLLKDFVRQVPEANEVQPYIFSAGSILNHFENKSFKQGITVTCPGFYAPQGRMLRLQPAFPQMIEKLSTFQSQNLRISNFEMETAAIYGLGVLLGHNCLSISAIVANRVNKTFSKDGQAAVDKLIEQGLEVLASLP